MWNNSKEQIEGVDLRGPVLFESEPEPRKMSADGAGGFFSASRTRGVWRVDKDGVAKEFGPAELKCTYCHVLSLSWDPLTRELHVLTAQWRDEAGTRKIIEGLKWWRLDGRGSVISHSPVPLGHNRDVPFYENVSVKANRGQTWVLGPNLWLHQDGRQWTIMLPSTGAKNGVKGATALGQQGEVKGGSQAPDSSAALYAVGLVGGIGLATVSTLAGIAIAPEPEQQIAVYTWLVGMLGAYYPTQLALPWIAGNHPDEPTSLGCLTGGLLGIAAITGVSVWGFGDIIASSVYEERYAFSGARLGGALGGAAVGTLVSYGLARLLYGDEPNPEVDGIVVILGTALTASFSMFGYYLMAEDMFMQANFEDPIIGGPALLQAPRGPQLQINFGF
jgi:hypothetical protein